MRRESTRKFGIGLAVMALIALACGPFGLGGGPATGELGDYVWFDANGNGLQDQEEQGIPGVTVRLLNEGGGTVAETTTADGGLYAFADVEAATYVIEFVPPEDMEFTLKDVGEDDSVDSDARMSDGRTDPFEFDGSDDQSRDAGLVEAPSPPTPVPPTPEPTATSTPVGFIPNFFVTYEHTSPGSYSTVLVFVFDGEPGSVIEGQVTGPAVDGDGSFTVTVDENGQATAMVRILQFGEYTVSVPEYDYEQVVPVGPGPPTPTPES